MATRPRMFFRESLQKLKGALYPRKLKNIYQRLSDMVMQPAYQTNVTVCRQDTKVELNVKARVFREDEIKMYERIILNEAKAYKGKKVPELSMVHLDEMKSIDLSCNFNLFI